VHCQARKRMSAAGPDLRIISRDQYAWSPGYNKPCTWEDYDFSGDQRLMTRATPVAHGGCPMSETSESIPHGDRFFAECARHRRSDHAAHTEVLQHLDPPRFAS
jgi:hypothetical protein